MNDGARHFGKGFVACAAATLLCALPATAQDAATDAPAAITLNTDMPKGVSKLNIDLPPSLEGAVIDLTPVTPLPRFSGTDLLGLEGSERNRLSPVDSFGTKPLTTGALGLDVELTPRAAVSFNDERDSALVGAIVRIGDDLKDTSVKKNTWYLFAGADAEAMTYAPGTLARGLRGRGDLGLQERIIVGDAQAGIGYRIGDADVSLGYFRREVSSFDSQDPSDNISVSEDAAALSFTWRR